MTVPGTVLDNAARNRGGNTVWFLLREVQNLSTVIKVCKVLLYGGAMKESNRVLEKSYISIWMVDMGIYNKY